MTTEIVSDTVETQGIDGLENFRTSTKSGDLIIGVRDPISGYKYRFVRRSLYHEIPTKHPRIKTSSKTA